MEMIVGVILKSFAMFEADTEFPSIFYLLLSINVIKMKK